MSQAILAIAAKIVQHCHREQLLKIARQELDDRGLADIGLSRTRGATREEPCRAGPRNNAADLTSLFGNGMTKPAA